MNFGKLGSALSLLMKNPSVRPSRCPFPTPTTVIIIHATVVTNTSLKVVPLFIDPMVSSLATSQVKCAHQEGEKTLANSSWEDMLTP